MDTNPTGPRHACGEVNIMPAFRHFMPAGCGSVGNFYTVDPACHARVSWGPCIPTSERTSTWKLPWDNTLHGRPQQYPTWTASWLVPPLTCAPFNLPWVDHPQILLWQTFITSLKSYQKNAKGSCKHGEQPGPPQLPIKLRVIYWMEWDLDQWYELGYHLFILRPVELRAWKTMVKNLILELIDNNASTANDKFNFR